MSQTTFRQLPDNLRYKNIYKRFWKKKRKTMSPRKKISPNHPGRRRKKKVYIIIIWEADVLPLHHKRVVENNTPSTFRRELFIDIYILSSIRQPEIESEAPAVSFLSPKEEEEEEEENTKFIQFYSLQGLVFNL